MGFLNRYFLKCLAAFDALERAKHRTALHVAKTTLLFPGYQLLIGLVAPYVAPRHYPPSVLVASCCHGHGTAGMPFLDFLKSTCYSRVLSSRLLTGPCPGSDLISHVSFRVLASINGPVPE